MEILHTLNTESRYNITKGQIKMAHLVCVMAREKRNIICSKVVADLLDLPIAFPFPPLGPTILEPNLRKI